MKVSGVILALGILLAPFNAVAAGPVSIQEKEVLPDHTLPNHFQGTLRSNIHFRDGQTTLDLSYRNNAAVLETFKRYVESVGTNNIVSVLIVSKDSPDGSARESARRAEQRAEAVKAYVCELFPQLSNAVSVSPQGESWGLLRAYIAKDGKLSLDSRIQAVHDLSPDVNLFRRKAALKKGGLGRDPNVGDISEYLQQKYFPLIRNTAIYIDLKK